MIDMAMETNLCVIAGGGILPRKIADNFDSSGNRIFFLAFRNVTDPEVVAGRHHEWLELGEVQKAIDAMHRNNVDKVVMAGPIQRPALSSLALDTRALKMLAKGGLKVFGDDGLLSLVAREIEKEGIKVVDAKLILEQARVIKSPEEIKCMRSAIDVAEMGIVKMREQLKPGMTENELWSILHQTNIENYGEWIECRLLASGERTNPWMQECGNKVIQDGEIVAFDTDMVGPYGYCADISRAFVVGNKFNDEQKKLYLMAVEQIDYNSRLIKDGLSFKEFTEKSWVLPEDYYPNRYSVMVHGIGLCDEWPAIRYPTDGGERSGTFQKNMTITVESYIGKVGGKEGVKLEQQYLIGENGLELMSHHPLEDI